MSLNNINLYFSTQYAHGLTGKFLIKLSINVETSRVHHGMVNILRRMSGHCLKQDKSISGNSIISYTVNDYNYIITCREYTAEWCTEGNHGYTLIQLTITIQAALTQHSPFLKSSEALLQYCIRLATTRRRLLSSPYLISNTRVA